VDDIVFSGDDKEGIVQLKQYLAQKLQTEDVGHLRYFLGMKWHNPRMVWSYLKENTLLTF